MFEIKISPVHPSQLDILVALIADMPIEGIREMDTSLLAYASNENFESPDFKERLQNLMEIAPFKYSSELLPDINWNEAWEQHFDPVVVEDFLTIKAEFHDIRPKTQYVVTIHPKMSFGTGHHATTWMMVKALSLLNLSGLKVLDAGTGTGILAIVAAKLGAEEVHAYDHDEWSYLNAIENFGLNKVKDAVKITEGSLSDLDEGEFDLILANINRNYLVDHAVELAARMAPGGILVVSGFYEVDSRKVLDPFLELNLVAQYLLRKDDWASIILYKNP